MLVIYCYLERDRDCVLEIYVKIFSFFQIRALIRGNTVHSLQEYKKYNDLKLDSHLFTKHLVICFIESPLKIMKNDFYFILKTFFVLKIFKLLSWLFGHVEKTFYEKEKFNFHDGKIHDVTTWLTNNCYTNIAQYLTK